MPQWLLTFLCNRLIKLFECLFLFRTVNLDSKLEWRFLIQLIHQLFVWLLIQVILLQNISWFICLQSLPFFNFKLVRFHFLTLLILAQFYIWKKYLLVFCCWLSVKLSTIEIQIGTLAVSEELGVPRSNYILNFSFMIIWFGLDVLRYKFIWFHVFQFLVSHFWFDLCKASLFRFRVELLSNQFVWVLVCNYYCSLCRIKFSCLTVDPELFELIIVAFELLL